MYSDSDLKQIWDKGGIVVEGYNKDFFRKDAAGAWIAFNSYGDVNSPFGWQVDHVYPQALGGGEDKENLRPMHWRNNESKGEDYPVYYTAIVAVDDHNELKVESRTINEKLQSKLAELYGKRG